MSSPTVKKVSRAASKKMESTPAASSQVPLYLVYGDDDFLVGQEARRTVDMLVPKGGGDLSVEIIEGLASNQSEAEVIFRRLFEALQTPTFFAAERVLWLRATNLLGTSSTATSASTVEAWEDFQKILKEGLPQGISVVISAGEVDARRGVIKTIQSLGKVVSFKSDPYKPEVDEARARVFVEEQIQELGLRCEEGVVERLVEMTDGDLRTLKSEIEKISTYLGDERSIRVEDVQEIGSWRPGGVAWDLPEALGERNLAKVLGCLDNLFFLGETPMGLLFIVMSRIRLLLLLRAIADKKLVHLGSPYASFKAQMERLPSSMVDALPRDKKLNPLAAHPYMLWKAARGATKFRSTELHQALRLLVSCNEKMVSSGGDPKSLLKQVLVEICLEN